MTNKLFRLKRTWVAVIGAASLTTGILGFVAPAISSADNAGGCDFSPANNGTPGCLGPLAGSTFAGGDGNLLTSPTTFGSTDWQNVAGLNAGFDLLSGSGDNSFGQGTKEDNPNATVVHGSIPNNKSDLTRFYEASEIGTNNDNFAYLSWERANTLGTANIDFEINQKTTPGFNGSTSGAVTLNRTAGDLLVTYDFTNGGGTPTIGLQRWLTSATNPVVPGFATNVCFSSNTFPCWGDEKTLDGTDSIGGVNNIDPVTDPLFPGSPNYINPLPKVQFGETAIDLTKAGVFPPGICEAFGSAFVKSRSSSSFTAEVKDFIAPIPINISNCGSIEIIKHTDPRGADQVFSYTSNLPAEPPGTVGGVAQGGVTCPGNANAGVQADGSFCLNDAGNSAGGDSAGNTVLNNALQAGTYTVTEGGDPSGFTFETMSCTGGSTSTSGKVAMINLKPGDQVVCTYVNQQNTATMKTQESTGGVAVPPGQAVHDTATVTGNQAAHTPSGTVTFFRCAVNVVPCSSGGTNIGTGTLSGSGATASATSPDVNTANPLPPGTYCFRAEWPGDTNYPATLTESGGAGGTNECFTVTVIGTKTHSTPSPGSGGSVLNGSTVTDTAVVTADQSGAGFPSGTVTFHLCNPTQVAANGGTCSSGGTLVGTVDTTDLGSTPPSSTATSSGTVVSTNGTWCFLAVYTPGPPNGAFYTGSSDGSSQECFTVFQIATGTMTTPSPGSGGTTTFGTQVTDHAVVTAAQSGGGTPTGTVTFFVCDPSQTSGGACPAPNGTQVGTTGVTPTAVVGSNPPASQADSVAITANKTGTWCFRAVYTPGGANGTQYTGSSDASMGECFTVNDTTVASSNQSWIPNDSASVSSVNGAPLNGMLTVQLYTGTGCVSANIVTGNVYHQAASGTASTVGLTTANTAVFNSDVSWLVTFSSTDPNVPSPPSHCESSSLTVNN
jgi:hypothetical protein